MTGTWVFIFFAVFLRVVYIILYRVLGKTLTELEKELNLVD